jgi:hypothetical protein
VTRVDKLREGRVTRVDKLREGRVDKLREGRVTRVDKLREGRVDKLREGRVTRVDKLREGRVGMVKLRFPSTVETSVAISVTSSPSGYPLPPPEKKCPLKVFRVFVLNLVSGQ